MLRDLIIGLSIGSAYSLLAVAVVLIYSSTKVLSLAVGEIGAFALYVALRWHERGWFGWHPSVFVCALLTIVGAGALGLLVERLVMRPMVGRPALDTLVATLVVALLLALSELAIYGINPFAAPSPVGHGTVRLLGATVSATQVTALLLAGFVAVALWLFLTRTSFGLATRAVTGDATVARLLGVKVNRVYVFAWGVGGLLSGAAAALLAPISGSLTPFSLTTALLSALAGAVIGGLDSLGGAIVGSLLVGLVTSVVGSRVDPTTSAGVIFLAVLVTLLVRPQGLLGGARASA
ncbi:MAG TPA: branched-chain amino acid ABC transporter permease [Mycobacteriales bacterium]|nr:branched-chain amino acid ABC transporter permease [Mycobacteriales bacterium]